MQSSFKSMARIAIVLIATLAAAAGLQAQDSSENPFQITGFAGVNITDLSDELEETGLDADPDVVFGGRLEYRFHPKWGVEGSVGFSPVQVEPLGDGADGSELDLDTWDIHGNIVYHFLGDQRFDPFVTGGAGVRIIDFEGGDTESFFAGNAGGGAQYWVSEHIAIRGEGRFYFYNVDEGLQNFDETLSDLQITGGVTFAF